MSVLFRSTLSIDVFEDYIYGVTSFDNHVFRVNKFGRGAVENLTTGINHATDLVLFHRYKQPDLPNPCDRKKCEWLCLLSPSGPVCVCPNGRTLDNGTCVELPPPTLSPLAPPSGPCAVQCLHGGSCFLNARRQPKCHCQPNYGGERCEVDQCRDYCLNGGTCAPSPSGSTTAAAKGHTGPRVRPAHLPETNARTRATAPYPPQPAHLLCPPASSGTVPVHLRARAAAYNGGQCLRGPDGGQQCRCPPSTGQHLPGGPLPLLRDGKSAPPPTRCNPTGRSATAIRSTPSVCPAAGPNGREGPAQLL
ncbi:unnamed protein product [Arctogadus glacialis]